MSLCVVCLFMSNGTATARDLFQHLDGLVQARRTACCRFELHAAAAAAAILLWLLWFSYWYGIPV